MGDWATVGAVRSYLPSRVLTNDVLSRETGWSAEAILAKTGISERRIAAPDECVSDMATCACQRLLTECGINGNTIEFLMLCTETPDHLLPPTSCLVHSRLQLPASCATFDINLGCSGYVYALSIADAFIRSGRFRNGLVVTADTYSKYINAGDRSVRTLFGDAASATWVRATAEAGFLTFALGTDGHGAQQLIIPAGGTRQPRSADTCVETVDRWGNRRSPNNLYMNGPALLSFALEQVPAAFGSTLSQAGLSSGEIDWFVFHQASRVVLERLRVKLNIPEERFCVLLRDVGNTVSSTIPIVLESVSDKGPLIAGQHLMLLGFGAGFSWGGTVLRWNGDK